VRCGIGARALCLLRFGTFMSIKTDQQDD